MPLHMLRLEELNAIFLTHDSGAYARPHGPLTDDQMAFANKHESAYVAPPGR